MIICQFIFASLKEKNTNTNELVQCVVMLPLPTKLFSTHTSGGALESAGEALRAAFGGGEEDFADAIFLLLPLVFFVERDCFAIVVRFEMIY